MIQFQWRKHELPVHGQARRRAQLHRPGAASRGHAAGRRLGAPRGRLQHPGPDRGRERRRQGADRPRHPGRERARRQAVRHRQLRRHPRQARREHPVRPREGRLHRRHRQAHRQVPGGRRRHPVPRRDRRAAPGGPGQAAARAARRRDRSGRRQAPDQGRTSASSRPPTATSVQAGQGGKVPRGPLLPPQRVPDPDTAAARAPRRRARIWRGTSWPASPSRRGGASGVSAPRRWTCSPAAPGPATYASWRTPFSAPWC